MGFRLSKETTIEDVDGTIVIVGANGDTAVLNGSGSVIARALLSEPTLESAVDSLLEMYSVDRETITKDVLTFADDLVRHDMIEEMT